MMDASSKITAKNTMRMVTGLLIFIIQNVASPTDTLNEANRAIPRNRTYRTSIKIITDIPNGLLRGRCRNEVSFMIPLAGVPERPISSEVICF
jgi:hypothetical protein